MSAPDPRIALGQACIDWCTDTGTCHFCMFLDGKEPHAEDCPVPLAFASQADQEAADATAVAHCRALAQRKYAVATTTRDEVLQALDLLEMDEDGERPGE